MMVNDINASGAVDRVPMLEMYGKNSYIGDVWCECDPDTGGVWCNCAPPFLRLLKSLGRH